MTLIALNCQIKKKSSLDSTSVLYSQLRLEVGKKNSPLSVSEAMSPWALYQYRDNGQTSFMRLDLEMASHSGSTGGQDVASQFLSSLFSSSWNDLYLFLNCCEYKLDHEDKI
jgi:hypothetical protein